MNTYPEKYVNPVIIIISFLAGFLVYSFLSYLFVTPRITIPLSIDMSVLVFGLARYYSNPLDSNNNISNTISFSKSTKNNLDGELHKKQGSFKSSIAFVTIFGLLILISSFSSTQDFHVFINWNNFSVQQIIQLAAAIALCFFVPGFAIALVISKEHEMNPLFLVLLAYILSILITGLTAYISALTFDLPTSDAKGLIMSVYVSILVFFVVFYPGYRINHSFEMPNQKFIYYHYIVNRFTKFWQYLKNRANEVIVFGSLFSLIIITTYYLYGGTTIGDQWYHQGRSLLLMSGAFREATITGAESFYPPFQSALLAALTVISGVPLVNAFASIAFVNIIPVFAFLYFFSTWIPSTKRKASLLACCLFTLSAGFGWIYLVNTSITDPILSPQSSLETIGRMGSLDIVSTGNFFITTAPQFSTALTYIALPAGFVLLAILRTKSHVTYTNIAIVTAISVLGMVSHDEFYFFIIIASLLPIIFRMQARNYVYVGLIFGFLIVYLIDIIVPGRFFTSNKIFGFPLLLLSLSFVALAWTIKLSIGHIHKVLATRLNFLKRLRKFPYYDIRFKYLTRVTIISLTAYIYLLSFVVLSQLPLETVIDHTRENTIPWYLYPMRMGIPGLLGLVFILSYIFKKFEKEVFVFGVIVVISFITGPYYDEHRFTKYMMLGMIGFSSIIIYNILNRRSNKKPLINSLLVGIIIISAGLSTLTYIGYTSLIFQTHDYENTLARRHFPSMSDLHLFEIVHDKTYIDSKKYNVASFLNEYNRLEDGIMAKLPAFSGLPYDKLRQSPLSLNASTLEALYHHLWYSDARYIIIPNEIKNRDTITESVQFLLDHLTPLYQDDNYTVLNVPTLNPPSASSEAKVALVYDQGKDLQDDIMILPYDSKTFDLKSNLVKVKEYNQTERLNLLGSGYERGISVWTKNITYLKGPNYIETAFQITSENESKANDVRIEWQDSGLQGYYVKLSKDGLELYKKSEMNKKILLKNAELSKLDWKWYTLKIESLPNSISIYIDNILKIQSPKTTGNNVSTAGVSKIGLTTFYNDVQFTPVKVGTIIDIRNNDNLAKNYDYNYPISLLALGKFNYETFNNNDLSVFSKNTIFIPDSILSDNVTINRYLDYAHDGGTIIIISAENFTSTASQVFSFQSNEGEKEAFTHISGDAHQKVSVNIPGWTKRINYQTLPEVKVIASYRNDKNQTIAPFILERELPAGGRIIMLNAEGYFNTISNFPKQYFSTLGNILNLLPIDAPEHEPSDSENNALPMESFVGQMKISGLVTLNSSSLLLEQGTMGHRINAWRIIVFGNNSNVPISYDNATIKDLKLIGEYRVNIHFKGQLELPDSSSYHDYIGMRIPADFNMSAKLFPKSSGHIEIVNHDGIVKSISLNNNSKIEFYKMKAQGPLISVPVLVKKPAINADGHIIIKKSYLHGYLTQTGKLNVGTPVDLEGHLVANFGFVDNFDQPYRNATKTQYITYLDRITMNGSFTQDKVNPRLPGDIYFKAKEQIPLLEILSLPVNGITIIGCFIVAFVVAIKLTRKQYPSTA